MDRQVTRTCRTRPDIGRHVRDRKRRHRPDRHGHTPLGGVRVSGCPSGKGWEEEKYDRQKTGRDGVPARPCRRPLPTVSRAKALDKRITYPLVVSECRETQGVQYPMLQRVARSKALDG